MRLKLVLALLTLGFCTLTLASPMPCMKLMSQFLHHEEKKESHLTISLNIPEADKVEILAYLKARKYSDAEIVIAIESLNELKKIPKTEKIEAYLGFISTYPVENKRLALRDLNQLGQREVYSPYMKRFNKTQIAVKKKEALFKEKKIAELTKTNPEYSADEIHSLATQSARDFRGQYEKLFYGCSARTMTPQHEVAQLSYTKFTTAIGLSATSITYAIANRDKEKNGEWYGRLGHELVYSIISNYISSKFTTAPQDSQFVKSFKNYMINRMVSSIDIVFYQILWGENERKGMAKLKKILNSPEFQEKIDKYMDDLNKPYAYYEFRKEFAKALANFKGNIGLDSSYGLPKDVNWRHLSQKDLERTDVQDVLISAATASLYEEDKGAVIQTGLSGLDRFSYNSAFGLIMVPGSMIKQYLIYQTLCMGQDNPKMATLKALMIYASYNLTSSQIYFEFRNMLINQ
ncbi:MAG: hypothetical protein KBD76_05970 [Bacteriovorax sp.]|jgi:hypothetical protein|nr:hypothetical protein [Bacteriovorax sp.]